MMTTIKTDLWVRVKAKGGKTVYINASNIDVIIPDDKKVLLRDASLRLESEKDIEDIVEALGFAKETKE